MSSALLYIRQRQIIYELKQLGIYSLFFFAIIVYFIFSSYKLYQDKTYAILSALSLAFVCFSIQSIRKDKQFIYLNIKNYRLSLYNEYFLITFPFIVMSLFTAQWYCFLMLQLLLLLISFNKFTIRQKTFFKNISFIIPVSHFEWISGFRKSFLTIIPVYFLALGFCWLKIFPLFLLWFLTMIIISFYNECEPLIILREKNQSAAQFLNKKLFTHTGFLIILYLPIVIINTIFNNDLLGLNVFFIMTQPALLFFAICYKYSNYKPNQFLYLNNIIVTLVSLSGLIPFLLPVPVIADIKYYFMAVNNLKKYFNA